MILLLQLLLLSLGIIIGIILSLIALSVGQRQERHNEFLPTQQPNSPEKKAIVVKQENPFEGFIEQ